MKKIAIFTGTRAEYDLLKPVALSLMSAQNCTLQLIVSGTHLSKTHGHTIDAIYADGFKPASCIPLDIEDSSETSICQVMGQALGLFAKELKRLAPDIVVLLGDRYETFAMAVAAHTLSIPMAHLYGGEITQGAIDDAFRHSITKMSHLHFTSCTVYRNRVIQMGEDPTTVFDVGAVGVENIKKLPLLSEAEIRQGLNIEKAVSYFVCTFHPVTIEGGTALQQVMELCNALENFPEYSVIFTGANADAGGTAINNFLQSYVQKNKQHRFFMSLGQVRYFSAVKYASCVIGNSSSGIIEVPSLGTAVVNTGNRQKGREFSNTVLHCSHTAVAITQTLTQALEKKHQEFCCKITSKSDEKHPTKSIVQTLLETETNKLLPKVFYNCINKVS